MSQAEIASELKFSRETPSRLIKELIEAGKIKKVSNKLFFLVDPEKTDILD